MLTAPERGVANGFPFLSGRFVASLRSAWDCAFWRGPVTTETLCKR